ncbi:MAG: helix-turn-helix transcriptional regulator [Spirochaetes bacterium]|nr:helix-turn-helix transcriptional regulator [Spirochaetota bacterium]
MSLRNALLGLLSLKARHGYELHAAFTALAGGAENWDVKPAQVYTTLARLKESGLVAEAGTEQSGGPEKRRYRLTKRGQGELAHWWSRAVEPGHARDEFFVKLMLAVAWVQAGPPGETRVDPKALLQAQRRGLFQELHRWTLRRDGLDPSVSLGQILLMEKAIAHGEAELRWLDRVESRLDEVRRQPVAVPEARTRGRPKNPT